MFTNPCGWETHLGVFHWQPVAEQGWCTGLRQTLRDPWFLEDEMVNQNNPLGAKPRKSSLREMKRQRPRSEKVSPRW